MVYVKCYAISGLWLG